MKNVNNVLALAFLCLTFSLNAQVNFKLAYDKETSRYTVSVVPSATYSAPDNITGTGQVTIKVPSNQFDPVDIANLTEGMYWEANSRNNTPEEAPDFDYISFGLVIQGIAFPAYTAGVELPLFSFENAFGCTGKVFIVDNSTDEFMPPNSQSANIGNTITILGAGGDAYGGILDGGECDCNESILDSKEELALESFNIFPNPAIDFANVEIQWTGDAVEGTLQVVDASGKKIMSEPMDLTKGANQKRLNVTDLPSGSYFLQLEGNGWSLNLDKLNKQR